MFVCEAVTQWRLFYIYLSLGRYSAMGLNATIFTEIDIQSVQSNHFVQECLKCRAIFGNGLCRWKLSKSAFESWKGILPAIKYSLFWQLGRSLEKMCPRFCSRLGHQWTLFDHTHHRLPFPFCCPRVKISHQISSFQGHHESTNKKSTI
jgi:hypothetical protein